MNDPKRFNKIWNKIMNNRVITDPTYESFNWKCWIFGHNYWKALPAEWPIWIGNAAWQVCCVRCGHKHPSIEQTRDKLPIDPVEEKS